MSATSTSIEIKAPLKKVYEVISDFESYHEFLTGSKGAKILKKSGKKVQVEFEMDMIKTIHYTLDITLDPPHGLHWTLVEGDFMKSNKGSWKLEESKKGITEATYEIEVGFGLLVPKSISSVLIGKNLPVMMKEFKKRIEHG